MHTHSESTLSLDRGFNIQQRYDYEAIQWMDDYCWTSKSQNYTQILRYSLLQTQRTLIPYKKTNLPPPLFSPHLLYSVLSKYLEVIHIIVIAYNKTPCRLYLEGLTSKPKRDAMWWKADQRYSVVQKQKKKANSSTSCSGHFQCLLHSDTETRTLFFICQLSNSKYTHTKQHFR